MPRKQKPSHEVPLSREVTNSDRAIWARIALEAFQAETGTDDEDALSDLIADLLHLADRTGEDFRKALDRGFDHYDAELAEDEPGDVAPKRRQEYPYDTNPIAPTPPATTP